MLTNTSVTSTLMQEARDVAKNMIFLETALIAVHADIVLDTDRKSSNSAKKIRQYKSDMIICIPYQYQ